MRDGKWTSERIADKLKNVSPSYLKVVLAGYNCPSESLANDIKDIIVPKGLRREVEIESLFPLLRTSSSASTDTSTNGRGEHMASVSNTQTHRRILSSGL